MSGRPFTYTRRLSFDFSGGRARHRSADLTLFRSDLQIRSMRASTGKMGESPAHVRNCQPSDQRWITLEHPGVRCLGHAWGTKLDHCQVFSASRSRKVGRRGDGSIGVWSRCILDRFQRSFRPSLGRRTNPRTRRSSGRATSDLTKGLARSWSSPSAPGWGAAVRTMEAVPFSGDYVPISVGCDARGFICQRKDLARR